MLPYGRQSIADADVEAVTEVLRGEWLTTGPMVGSFEAELARWTGGVPCLAVTSIPRRSSRWRATAPR
jgi:dTDP-4-amino-4,6-dideoxygalactose transaminase